MNSVSWSEWSYTSCKNSQFNRTRLCQFDDYKTRLVVSDEKCETESLNLENIKCEGKLESIAGDCATENSSLSVTSKTKSPFCAVQYICPKGQKAHIDFDEFTKTWSKEDGEVLASLDELLMFHTENKIDRYNSSYPPIYYSKSNVINLVVKKFAYFRSNDQKIHHLRKFDFDGSESYSSILFRFEARFWCSGTWTLWKSGRCNNGIFNRTRKCDGAETNCIGTSKMKLKEEQITSPCSKGMLTDVSGKYKICESFMQNDQFIYRIPSRNLNFSEEVNSDYSSARLFNRFHGEDTHPHFPLEHGTENELDNQNKPNDTCTARFECPSPLVAYVNIRSVSVNRTKSGSYICNNYIRILRVTRGSSDENPQL